MADDAFGAVAELAASQHGAFTPRQAAALAIPASTLQSWRRRGLIWPALPGVFLLAGRELTWRTHLAAASLSHGSDTVVVSHRAAVALHGLDGIHEPFLEVTVARDRTVRLPGFRIHRSLVLDPADVTFVDGIRVTSIARTVADLGAVATDELVAQVLDDALRRGVRRRWIEQTLQRIDRPGPSGTSSLRRVLARYRDLGRTDSWFETLVLERLVRGGIAGVVAQYPVRSAAGKLLAVLDAAVPEVKLGIEAHSKRFHFGERKNTVDADRDFELAVEGWELMYVRFDEARSGAVVDRVRRLVDARAAAA